MKKQIFSVIVGAVTLAVNPAFAMDKEDAVAKGLSLQALLPNDVVSESNTKFILQQEACIIEADDEQYVAVTLGVGPCVAFSIYNPILRKGVLAHLDALQLSLFPSLNMEIPLFTNINSIISACTDENDRSQCSCTIYSRLAISVTVAEKYMKDTYPEILCNTMIGDTGGVILNAKTGLTYENQNRETLYNIYLSNGLPPLQMYNVGNAIKWK